MGDFSNNDLHEYFKAGHTGFWKQEFEKGKHPRIYTDDIMDSLIGTSDDMTPEEKFDFFGEHIHPDDMGVFSEYIKEIKVHESEVVYRYIHPVTGNMYVRCTGRPIISNDDMISIVGYHQEATDVMHFEPYKLLENQLAKQNQELKDERQRQDYYYGELLDMISCGVLAYTLPEHRVVHINAEARRIYGLSTVEEAQEKLASRLSQIKYNKPETVEKLKRLRTERGKVDYECSIANDSGHRTPVLAKTEVFTTPKGEKSVVTTFIDISENVTLKNEKIKQKEYQEQLVLSMEEAKRANIAKTDFLRRMSHDIRTPINGIMGMISIGEHYSDNLEKQNECRGKIKEASGFLLELINNILDMNKLESGNVVLEHTPFDLREMLKEVNNITEMNAQEYAISYNIDNTNIKHPHIIGSPLHLHQILQNLDGNAIKYNKAGGSINVSCNELEYKDGKVTFEFICQDTGIGMSEEFQRRAFEPFSQENGKDRNTYIGTGLGLAITKQLVELMGGSISLESKLGEGTRFKVVLTFDVDKEYKKTAKQQDIMQTISLDGIKILLAEDNDLNMEIARFLLEKEGAVITEARNGKEAVDIFEKSPLYHFDVILMDVMMPVMDGLTATRQIRAMKREDAKTMPIFAMTANAFQEDIQASHDAGMTAHLSKPLNEQEIYRMINRYVNE